MPRIRMETETTYQDVFKAAARAYASAPTNKSYRALLEAAQKWQKEYLDKNFGPDEPDTND